MQFQSYVLHKGKTNRIEIIYTQKKQNKRIIRLIKFVRSQKRERGEKKDTTQKNPKTIIKLYE